MQLNENIKISIFKKNEEKTIDDKDLFVHYWNNKEENYPDCSDIEEYLKPYISSGNYSWVEIQDTSRFVRSKILSATLTLNISDRLSVDQIFVKVDYSDGSEIPQYYYGTEIDVMTNQNNPTNDYTILLELDMWSTVGCKFHALMKEDRMTQHFLCNRKMCDRFLYEENIGTEEEPKWVSCKEFVNDNKHRLGLNFMLQPWLLNSGNYSYPLIQANNDLTKSSNELKPLKLTDWLKMNGCTEEQLGFWNENGNISYIICKDDYSKRDGEGNIQKGNLDYVYNNNEIKLSETDMKLMNDSLFNSKGKYRYLVVKFGSNNTWNYKLDKDDTDKQNAYKDAKTALKNYPDLQTLLTDVVMGGGASCITTKKVQAITVNHPADTESSYSPIYLNGEVVCLIPIPKGKFEQLYLFYLNSHDKGIVLGNGTIIGMVVNDIPPSIFASALRKYNVSLDNSNMQTIGDKVSLTTTKFEGQELPFAWTSLRLDGNWDWNPTHFLETAPASAPAIQGHWTQNEWSETEWWRVGADFYLHRPRGDISTEKEYYCRATKQVQNDSWDQVVDPVTGVAWRMSELWIKSEGTYIGPDAYFHYTPKVTNVKNPGWVKENWELLCTWSGEYVRDDVKKITDTPIIPPASSTKDSWYHYSQDTANTLYYNPDTSHYFPTIFHDFSYIPITVAHKENSVIEGQGSWFNIFNEMLTNKDIYSTNNRWSEPFLWGPQFYQWVYFTDGLSKITLTADQVDWFKIYKPIWNVNLRTNMSSTTNLKLDIDDIVNENYPFSKSASEFIISDQNKYPFTTEAYNTWYEQNAVSEVTSKRAKDITNEFSRTKYPVSAGLNLFSSTAGGAAAGAVAGSWGALIGGIAGLIGGGISWAVGQNKLDLEISQADQEWANEWAQTYGNLYGRPAEIVADGFTSGSLLYTPNGEASESFELFRMFTINPEARDAISEEIFTSGYPYMRMCEYKDYDNRAKFNIINLNLDEKNAIVNNYLKREFSKKSLIFSQQQFIDWFKAKCKSKIRLFKDTFSYLNMDELIKDNIENSMTINKK